MAKYSWSQSQTQAIDSTCSCIVSASAGSGKTTLMIERMMRQMKAGTDIEHMLAVTFAEAQATDMRNKLASALSAELSEGALSMEELRRLKSCYYKLPSAQISTLHAFCSTVIRRYFYLTDMGADFSVSSGADNALRRAAVVEEVLNDELKKGEADFLMLYEAFSHKRSHARLVEAIFQISNLMDTSPDVESVWVKTSQNKQTAERILAQMIASSRAQYLARFDMILAEMRTVNCYAKLFKYVNTFREGVAEFFGKAVIDAKSMPSLPVLSNPTKEDVTATNVALHDKVHYLRTQCAKANKKFVEITQSPDALETEGVAILYRLTVAFRNRYASYKARDGVVDFHDLESLCYTILQDDAARTEIQARYREVFVDEYQDINPMQEAILCALDSGRTFFVGDVKQSIYGFRLCDPTIFLARFARMEASGNAIVLNANYRTTDNILRFCDFVFSGLMTADFGGTNYEEVAKFVPTIFSKIDPDVEVLIVDQCKSKQVRDTYKSEAIYSVADDEARTLRADKNYREGQIIAEEIRALIGRGLEGKAVAYRDIAILLRSVKEIESFVRALQDNGIPINRQRDMDLFRATNVLALVALMRVLTNASNDYPLLAVMKQFFDFNDDELTAIRLHTPGVAFYKAVERYDGERRLSDKLGRMRSVLTHLRSESCAESPAEVLREAVEATDYFAKVLAGTDGMAQYQLVKRFLAETEASVYNVDLATYLDFLDANPTFMVEINDSDADAVTVTTIHKAKGLEYPIVFLARMHKEFNSRDERNVVFASRELGIVMNDFDEEERTIASNRLTETTKIAIRKTNRVEEVRTLYVALTRAKYKLYLVGIADASTPRYGMSWTDAWQYDSPFEWILSAISTDNRVEASFATGGMTPNCLYQVRLFDDVTRVQDTALPRIGAVDAGLAEELESRLTRGYPYARHVAKTTATEVNSRYPVPYEAGGERLATEDASTVGTAYHCVMQHLDFCKENIAEQKLLMQKGNLLTSEQSDMVNDKLIHKAMKTLSPKMQGRVLRETPFLAKFSSTQLFGTAGDDILVQGVVDVMIEDSDGWTLVDYKTTSGSADYLRKAYEKQLGIYAFAMTRSGFPIRKAYIYSFALGEILEVDTSAFLLG